jgi:hypothetical protein
MAIDELKQGILTFAYAGEFLRRWQTMLKFKPPATRFDRGSREVE